jgi:hypothetical protein
MSEPVFVDASAWVAIANRTDRVNDEALRLYHRLLRSQTPLITSTWTAYEALTIVKTKLGYNQAEKLWQRMLRPSVVTLIKVDERIEAGALELFWSYQDKDWGVVDVPVFGLWKKPVASRSSLSTDTSQRRASNTVFHLQGNNQL